MDNVQNSTTMVQQAYASQSDGLTNLDMSSMSIDNILQYVVLTLMQTRDNASSSIQGLMASVQANNKTASDIQNEANAVQGKIPAEDTDTVKKSDKGVVAYCRCWRSKKFPYCDGAHAAHNKKSGDNTGPLVIKK